MKIEITRKQKAFLDARADEVLFGGAAGGGKSYGQLIDALLYAARYPKSKQLVLRRTFPDLQRSLILESLGLYPKQLAKYNSSAHRWSFYNGSMIEFGYCDNEKDVYRYQGAEYDVIRFDELTHFTETMYTYLLSRLRGANEFPKSIKSSTNPGGVGHCWVKERFIDAAAPNEVQEVTLKDGSVHTRLFIPSRVQDNKFLMEKDPQYISRLQNLSEKDQKALLYGDWDIFEGQYFTEFKRDKHVIQPFAIPAEWRRYLTLDYGLDMLAVLWIAVDSLGQVFVYRELALPDQTISAACKGILELTGGEKLYLCYGPPDLWSRSQESGKCKADLFRENGVYLVKSSNDRETGWLTVKELLRTNETGESRLHIFQNCTGLCRCLPALQYDQKNPTDCATEPHEVTHLPDALRYFSIQWIVPAKGTKRKTELDQYREALIHKNKNKGRRFY